MKNYRDPFFRKKTSAALVELCEAYELDRLVIRFRKYDTKRDAGDRITEKSDIYLKFSEALHLAWLIGKGVIKARADKKAPVLYESPLGGYSCKDTDEVRYRKLCITEGSKAPFALSAREGSGERMETGLIRPLKAPDAVIFLPLTEDDLTAFGAALFMAVESADLYGFAKAKRKREAYQFIKLNSSSALLEVCDCYEKERIRVGFRRYDTAAEKGKRLSGQVDIFLDVCEAVCLSELIRSGALKELREKALNVKTPLFETRIGGKGEGDGVRYRRMSLFAGSKSDYAIGAQEGKGKRNDKGLILPQEKADVRIFLPLSGLELKAFADALMRAADLYSLTSTMQWMKKSR